MWLLGGYVLMGKIKVYWGEPQSWWSFSTKPFTDNEEFLMVDKELWNRYQEAKALYQNLRTQISVISDEQTQTS